MPQKKSWFSGKSAVANITSDREKSISTFAQIHERYLSDLQWSQIQKDCDIFVVEFLLILKLKLCSLVNNDCSRTKISPRANFQMNDPKISANTAKRAHHSSDRAPCPPASFKILENSWAGGLNALCTLKKLGEGKRSKNSCPWGKSWSMDLISANFVIFYNFVSASGASSSPKSTVPAQPTWMSCRITPLGRRWWGGWC